MTKQSLSKGVAACFLAVAMCAGASAATVFFHDDFEDGSATDGSPVTWVPEVAPFPVGDAHVENGSLVLTATPSDFYTDLWQTNWEVEQILPADVSVRTQVRALGTGGSYQGIYARDTHNVDALHGVALAAYVTSGGQVGFVRVRDGVRIGGGTTTDPVLSSLDRDIHLELTLMARKLSVYAWPDGSPRPTEPLVQSFDVGTDWMTPGRIGILAGQTKNMPLISSAFRFVEVVPEPSSCFLVMTAFGGIVISARRRKKGPPFKRFEPKRSLVQTAG